MVTRVRASIALALVFCATPAAAQNVTAADPQSIVAALQAEGYQAKLTRDTQGDPLIESAVDGTRFRIFFYGCTAGKACATIQFYAGFTNPGKATVATMNEWNKTRRFSRAYIDKENDPVIEVDIDLDDGGLSRALFANNLEFWASTIPAFKRHITG